MEQRILQYRKQIDEWLTEMEQNVQTLSQHGEYAGCTEADAYTEN